MKPNLINFHAVDFSIMYIKAYQLNPDKGIPLVYLKGSRGAEVDLGC